MVTHTAGIHSLAHSLVSEEESALEGHTFIVIVGLAVLDIAVAVVEGEGLVAFLADVFDFILAAKDGVLDADVVVETEAFVAISADLSLMVGEFHAIFDGLNARTSFQIET